MTVRIYINLFLVGLLAFSDGGIAQVKVKEVELTEVKKDLPEEPLPYSPKGLQVSAYLIFDDKTISTFDVLNDKTIALWNTIIGSGDALKPSHKTKILISGKLDSLKLTIVKGKKIIENKLLPAFTGDFEFIINDTGCEEIRVTVSRQGKKIFRDSIPFKCGE